METFYNLIKLLKKKKWKKKKLKTYVEKVTELIIKYKLRLCQLTGKDPAEIIVLFTIKKIKSKI